MLSCLLKLTLLLVQISLRQIYRYVILIYYYTQQTQLCSVSVLGTSSLIGSQNNVIRSSNDMFHIRHSHAQYEKAYEKMCKRYCQLVMKYFYIKYYSQIFKPHAIIICRGKQRFGILFDIKLIFISHISMHRQNSKQCCKYLVAVRRYYSLI